MKKKIPMLKTDAEAARFVDTADLSKYDLSGLKSLKMKNPPHPGFSVRVDCLEPHGLSVTEGAKVLGVSRSALSHLVTALWIEYTSPTAAFLVEPNGRTKSSD